MANITQRAPDQRHELGATEIYRDVRSVEDKIRDFFAEPMYSISTLLTIAGFGMAFPLLVEPMLLLFVAVFFLAKHNQKNAPFALRVPAEANKIDHHDLHPATGQPRVGAGTYFVGNAIRGKRELWLSNDDVRRHMLILGTTGAGKTEFILSICANFLVQGSGIALVDGKADTKLYAQMYSLARLFGREMDVRVLNWMSGGKDIRGAQSHKFSNTINPFASGSSSMIANLVTSLISKTSDTGGGDLWQGRAISFVEALIKPLTYVRDHFDVQLDANLFLEFLDLSKLEVLIYDLPKAYPNLENETRGMKTFFSTLSGYNPEKRARITDPDLLGNFFAKVSAGELDTEKLAQEKREREAKKAGNTRARGGGEPAFVLTEQPDVTREQFGYVTMQLTRIFISLAFTYKHIMRHPLPEIDMHDVVLNRRILVVLIPALEKSLPEAANLGKLVVASVKMLMASALGAQLEGSWKQIVEVKPSNSKSSFFACFDEYGAYAVEGFFVAPAQARGLAISCCFAGQDVPAFQRVGEEESQSIFANCNAKFFGKVEDGGATADLASKSAGEAAVAKIHGYKHDAGIVSGSTMDRDTSVDRVSKVNVSDLRDQKEGQYHLIHEANVHRIKVFFANPKPVREVRVNHFVPIRPPTPEQITEHTRGLNSIRNLITREDAKLQDDDIAVPSLPLPDLFIGSLRSSRRSAYEAMAGALASVMEAEADLERDAQAGLETGMADRPRMHPSRAVSMYPVGQGTNAQTGIDAGSDDSDVAALQASLLPPAAPPRTTSIFSRPYPPMPSRSLPGRYVDADDDAPILDRAEMADNLTAVGQAAGETQQEARAKAEAYVAKVDEASAYPRKSINPLGDSGWAHLMDSLSAAVDHTEN